MSKADDYRLRIEFSTIRAELSQSDELRTTWLRIRESYQHLLQLETSLVADLAFDVANWQAQFDAERRT